MKKRIVSLLMAVLLVVTMLPVAAMAEELTPDEPAGEPVVSEAVTTEPAGEETPAGEDETETEQVTYTGEIFTAWGTKCGQYAEPADAATAVYVKYTASSGEIICQAVKGEAADGGDRVTVDGVVYTAVEGSALMPIAHIWIADTAEDSSVSTYTCQTCKTVATVIASMDVADSTKSHERLPDGSWLEFSYTVDSGDEPATVTRIEWVKMLVDTFRMTVEGGNYPDNYYTDIDSTADYYRDLMVAVEFGVIDLAAGSEFRPEEPATREFAAHTLNYCLAFQLDENTYTYSDTDDVTYKDDVQVAVNCGWFALVDDSFLPRQAVTADEAEAMLADAEEVFFGTTVTEGYNSTYEFKADVTVIPEGTEVTVVTGIDENGDETGTAVVSITDCPKVIEVNSLFAVYLNGIPVAYTAKTVTQEGSVTRIEATPLATEDAFTSIDAQGVVEADMSQITALGGTELSYYVEELDQEFQTYALARAAARKVGVIKPNIELHGKISMEMGGVTLFVEATITNPTVKYNINLWKGIAFVTLNYDLEVEYRGEIELKKELLLCYWGIPGVGGLKITLEPALIGGISGTQNFHIEQGVFVDVKSSVGNKVRLIKGFNSKEFALTADVTGEIGVVAKFGITDLPVFNLYVYAEVGGKCTVEITKHTTEGSCTCVDFGAHVYAEAGLEGSIELLFFKAAELKIDKVIFDENNSPHRVAHHYENGVKVAKCTQTGNTGWQTPDDSPNSSNGWSGGSNNQGQNSAGETYTLFDYMPDADGNATITGYKGNAWTLIIPKTLDGHKVVAIGRNAFANSQSKAYLKTVVIPEGVTSIASGAFSGCLVLQKVTFPSTLKEIKRSAFYQCVELTSVELPAGLEILDCYAFSECTALRRVTLPVNFTIGNDGYIPYNGPFEGCTSLTNVIFPKGITRIPNWLFYNCPGLRTITIPDTVTSIGGRAFSQCEKLRTVNLPDSLVTIEGDYAFAESPALTEITLPKNLETIGERAFSDCANLQKVVFPEGLKAIYTGAFANCTALTSITLPSTLTEMNALAFCDCTALQQVYIPASLTKINMVIGPTSNFYGPFEGCSALSDVTFEAGATQIPDYLFFETGLQSITIPDTVTSIGGGAFENCDKLAEINFPDSLTAIEGEYAFARCKALTEIVLPKNLETIGLRVFYECVNLQKVVLPEGLKAIKDFAFGYCTSLSDVTLPSSLVELDACAFGGCTSLEKINIPAGLTSVLATGNYAYGPFEGCSALKTVTFGEGITRIPNWLFYKCSALETIEIPETVTVIDSHAFRRCTSLTKITLPAALTAVGEYAFAGSTALTELTLPQGLASLGARAFMECTGLKKITIPKGVSLIGDQTFYGCTSLESVVLSSGVKEILSNVFGSCTNLKSVTIPASVVTIYNNAFSTSGLTIYGAADSKAQSYAKSKEYKFVPLQVIGTVSGDGGDAPVSITITGADGETTEIKSTDGNYQFELDPGTYTIALTKEGCVPYRSTVTVDESGKANTVDVVLVARGNINGAAVNGEAVEITDVACLYEMLTTGECQSKIADPEYLEAVADVNSDGTVDVYDLQRLYETVSRLRDAAED